MLNVKSPLCRLALAAALAALAGSAAAEPGPGEPGYGVRFNQQMVDRLQGAPNFNIDDPMAAFGHVFAALADDVTVYPTENYYYFTFYWSGMEFAGNMRLDVADRDDGVLHFAYFNKNEPWNVEILSNYRPLTEKDGVKVEKVGNLVYAVTYEGRTVRFHLNDLREVKAPEGMLAEGDRLLGPTFDESGIAFFLVFNEPRKAFMFVLNENEPLNDVLVPYNPDHPALTVGMRTGFAFYEDRFSPKPRKVLVGVYGGNVDANNYFDGPFDQLPDNFIPGEELREAITTKVPELKGEIDRLGAFRSQEGRFLVNPYVNYQYPAELERFLRCGDVALDEAKFYACLAPPEEE